MDYYNFNSGFTDSLDFFNPAAQKNSRSRHRVFAPEYSCGEDVLYTRKQVCFDQSCQKPSSNSLILKRTRGREVTEQSFCENIRYRPCPPPKLLKSNQNIKNRPLIRVTVIPNNNTYKQTKLRKHKPNAKKIQSTVSNHESFFKAKNIFLVVGGNKREKIYEIKTTGSEYSNGTRYAKNEEIPLEQNFQQLLNSLNMDKKKKKDKGKGKKEKDKKKEEDFRVDEQESDASLKHNIEYESPLGSMLRDCMCSHAIDVVTPRKSRVTITGRIGRTEDDRYVLRCNATIDGTPVESNFYQDQNVSSPEWKAPESKPQDMKEIPKVSNLCKCIPSPRERVFYCQRETLTEPEAIKLSQKDESVQTAFQFDDSYRQTLGSAYIQPCPAYATPCPAYTTPCPAFRSVETQSSPRNVNAVCFSNVEKLNIYSSKDEVVQCNCPPDLLALSKDIAIEADYEVNSPKSCNSPLVIISVYPKPDSDDKYTDETSSTRDSFVSPLPREKGASNKKGGKKKQDKKTRAASPSPSKSPVKGKEKLKDKIKEKGKDKADKNKQPKGNKKGPKKGKPEREEKEKTGKDSRSSEKQQNTNEFRTSFKCAECCMGCIGNRNKQAIQETTQNNKKRVMNWVSAKNDISNVAINIDGENEFYDVLLRQGDVTTDLQVRKTTKDAKFAQGPVDSGSLENFLLVNGDQSKTRNRSFSQTDFLDQRFASKSDTLDLSVPRLNVRDSIEICHRREEKNSCVAVTNSASSSSSTDKIKLANNKHFKGDNCKLPNPVARDKEIRELLGIEKTKSKPSRTYQEFAANAEMDYNCSLHCFYRRQRKANVSNVHNIHELKKQLYMGDEVTLARHSDDIHYPVDEFGDSSDYNNDAHDNIDLCSDSDIIAQNLKHSHIIFESKLGRLTTKTKNAHEEGFSRSNTKKSKQHHHKPSQIYVSDSIPKVEYQIPQTTVFSKCKNICVPEASEDPCRVIIQCPYRQPNEESSSGEGLEEEQVESETSTVGEEQQITKEEYEEVQEITSNEHQQSKNAPLYQQLVLNRNINIYLQIEQFTKQKPIILSHKQYNKVKKTIESATGKKSSGKVMCICKPQSGDIKKKLTKNSLDKKSISPKTSKKVSDKVICECKSYGKEIKKSIYPKTHKDKEGLTHTQYHNHTIKKCNKHKLANFDDPPTIENNLNSNTCCGVNLVGSDNSRILRTEILYMPSRTFLLDDQETPTLTNQPKLFAEGLTINNTTTSKRFNDTIKEKSRITPAEKIAFEGTENKDDRCRKFITSKYHDEVYGEENMHSKTKPTRLDEENVRKFEETRFRKTKHSKIDKEDNYNENEKKRSKKRVECYQDIGNHDETQNIRSQKVKHLKSSLSIDNTVKKNKKNSKKKPSYYAEGQSLEKKKSVIEHCWEGQNESVNNIPGPVFCQEEQTADIAQDQFCKRCRRLKPLNYSGNHDRHNNFRLKTCYCCEVNEKGSESLMDDMFSTNLVKDRQYAASSTEVRYASVIYANYKHVTFSSMNVADNNIPIIEDYIANPIPQDSNSIHTIFKRRRRTPTPNLGTSAYSLCSTVASTAAKVGSPRQPVQERKPFLRRLMSCLVMRSKTSGVKINVKPAPKWNSANSSSDSYRINTSLGAIELSSSIYDTSASFYSNHSIQPISSKIIKRGFLSSVRGFLTNRKV